jgi:uncharacterized protein (TIGR00369 family)
MTGTRELTDTAGTTLSGLELVRNLQDQGPSAVGIVNLLGMRIDQVDEGRVVFLVETRPDFANPQGTVHGGIAATMLDSAMGCAVLSALPPGAGFTTIDLAISYVRSVAPDGARMRAEGKVVHLGGRIATAEGRMTDGTGRLVATATTTCMVFRDGQR